LNSLLSRGCYSILLHSFNSQFPRQFLQSNHYQQQIQITALLPLGIVVGHTCAFCHPAVNSVEKTEACSLRTMSQSLFTVVQNQY